MFKEMPVIECDDAYTKATNYYVLCLIETILAQSAHDSSNAFDLIESKLA